MNSISFKIGFIYIILVVLNIFIFIIAIYTQQNILLIQNRETEIIFNAEKKILPINYLFLNFIKKNEKTITKNDTKIIINNIAKNINQITNDQYIFFTDKNEVIFKSSENINFEEFNKKDALIAFSNFQYLNQPYLLKIYNNTGYMYIPLKIGNSDQMFFLLKFEIKKAEQNLIQTYRIIIIVIIITLFFHIIFWFLIYYILLRSVKIINDTAMKIRNQKIPNRIKIKTNDEIGQLGNSFNILFDLIEEKNKIIDKEKNASNLLLEEIFPKPQSNEFFDISIFHETSKTIKPDYFDIFKINEQKYGFLMTDLNANDISSIFIMKKIQYTFNRYVNHYNETDKLFMQINTELNYLYEKFSCLFFAFYILINHKNNIIYSAAGHLSGYLVRYTDKKAFELKTEGPLLGKPIDPDEKYYSKTININTGDKIILLSKKILELKNQNNEQYPINRLLMICTKFMDNTSDEIKNYMINDLKSFIENRKIIDDLSLIVITIKNQ